MTTARISVLVDEPIHQISPLAHGHFAEHLGRCCYDGLWVGRDSSIPNIDGFNKQVVEALKAVGITQLRWPGGCFADTYHWRDGIGDPASRPRSLAESCGLNVVDDNQLGTHEFINLCNLIGAEPYLAGNVGSGSAQELMNWIEYCNCTLDSTLARERTANGHAGSMNVKYWGVGNENWSCGGNYDAVEYAKEFRRFATFAKQADSSVELVACGDNKRDWNLKLLETSRHHLNFLDHVSVHQYWASGHATEFTEAEYYQVMRGAELIDEDIKFTDELIRFFAGRTRKIGIAFDEWGIWHPQAGGKEGYEADSTLRDAVAAAAVLDTFHKWAGVITMANIAQIVNVLHCLVQTKGEKAWVTPTYHLFDLYRGHQGALSLRTDVVEAGTVHANAMPGNWPEPAMPAGQISYVSASASLAGSDLRISFSNRHFSESMDVEITVPGKTVSAATIRSLTGDSAAAHNTADSTSNVTVTETSASAEGTTIRVSVPAHSVHTITAKVA